MQLFSHAQGEGFPLLILHGLFGSGNNWQTLIRKRFSNHYHAVAVDQRNHGRSPHGDAFDYPTLSEDLGRLIHANPWPEVALLGHSLGGKTAMHYALHHPEQVAALVVVDIAPRPYPERHAGIGTIIDALSSLELARFSSRSEVDAALARRLPAEPQAVRQFLLTNLLRDGDGYRWQLNLESISKHRSNVFKDIDAPAPFERPTLVIRGGLSEHIQDNDWPIFKERFPNAEQVIIEDAAHWVHAQAPGPFADAVLAFLDQALMG